MVQNKKLSILICTIEGREDSLEELLSRLSPQTTDEVEILIEKDKAQNNISIKRNKLLDRSIGDYVCFVDDDDMVSEDYVSEILKGIETKPDVVGFKMVFYVDGVFEKIYNHTRQSLSKSTVYYEDGKKHQFHLIDHLNPVKREHAIKTKFSTTLKRGEDTDYAKRIQMCLRSEVLIDKVLYMYLFQTVEKTYYGGRIRHW